MIGGSTQPRADVSSATKKRTGITTFQVFFWIGWALLFLVVVGVIIIWLKVSCFIHNALFTFSTIDGHERWLPLDDDIRLSDNIPATYDANVAAVLLDRMTRYMYLYLNPSADWETPKDGTVIVQKIYTERGTQMSCLILKDEMNNIVILFKGTTTHKEAKTDLNFYLTQNTFHGDDTLHSQVQFNKEFSRTAPNVRPVESASSLHATEKNILIHVGFHAT